MDIRGAFVLHAQEPHLVQPRDRARRDPRSPPDRQLSSVPCRSSIVWSRRAGIADATSGGNAAGPMASLTPPVSAPCGYPVDNPNETRSCYADVIHPGMGRGHTETSAR